MISIIGFLDFNLINEDFNTAVIILWKFDNSVEIAMDFENCVNY